MMKFVSITKTIRLALLLGLFILFLNACNTPNTTNTKKQPSPKTTNDASNLPDGTNMINIEQLDKDVKQLRKLPFKDAKKQFGKPIEYVKFKLIDGEIPGNIEGIVEKQFPNKEYQKYDVFLLEAVWKRQKESWITVWYLFQKGMWQPVDILVDI